MEREKDHVAKKLKKARASLEQTRVEKRDVEERLAVVEKEVAALREEAAAVAAREKEKKEEEAKKPEPEPEPEPKSSAASKRKTKSRARVPPPQPPPPPRGTRFSKRKRGEEPEESGLPEEKKRARR